MEADGGTDDEKNGQSDQAYNCFLYLEKCICVCFLQWTDGGFEQSDQAYNCFLYLTELVYTFPEAIFIVFLLPLLFFV